MFSRTNSYKNHILDLCSYHNIKLIEDRHRNGEAVCGTNAKIIVPPVNNERNYMTALHEIGHCVIWRDDYIKHARLQNPEDILNTEFRAWEWAFAHVSPAVEISNKCYRSCCACLRSYHLAAESGIMGMYNGAEYVTKPSNPTYYEWVERGKFSPLL